MASVLEGLLGGAQIGASLGSQFTHGNYSKGIGEAQRFYEDYLKRAQQTLSEHEKAGRADITGGLTTASEEGAPYRAAGEQSLQQYLSSLGLGSETGTLDSQRAFQASPAYQFALQQGLKSIERGAATRGLLGSGAEQQALTKYATGLASQEYGTWQDRLAQLAGAGRLSAEEEAQRQYGAGGELAGLGTQYGGILSSMQERMGQSMAEAALAKAQQEAEEKKRKHGGIGGILGGIAGAVLGGPAGSAIGSSLGSLLKI